MADLWAAVTAGHHLVAHIPAAPRWDVTFKEPKALFPAEARPHPAQFARGALTLVADNLACVPAAGEHLPAGLAAVPRAASAHDLFLSLSARTPPPHPDLTLAALPVMALSPARVYAAPQLLPTDLTARELLVRTAAPLGDFAAEARCVHLVRAGRTGARMAQQQARVAARRLQRLAADLPAGVGCAPQVDWGVDHLATEAAGLCGALGQGVGLAALGAFPCRDDVGEEFGGEDLGPSG